MDPPNRREALREMRLDLAEGADALMVKPALPYLDILADARREFDVPLAAYQVSGEYAMIHAAAERDWIDGERAMHEALVSIKRAGADLILTLRRGRHGCGPARLGSGVVGVRYKVVELSDVTDEAIENTLNEWTAQGWTFDTLQFAMRDSSRRPSMAFLSFTRPEDDAAD